MSLQDLASDFVARINNGIMANKPAITVLKSKFVESLCNKLTKMGYFESFEVQERTIDVVVNLEKTHKLKRMSKPGQRSYVSSTSFPRILNGRGYNIVTTSKGILTHVEAKKEKVGGELVLQIV